MNRPVAVGPVLTETGFGVLTAQHLPPSTDLLEIHQISQTEFVVEHYLAYPSLKRKSKIVETRKFETKEAAIAARDAWGADLIRKHEQNEAAIRAFQVRRKKRKAADLDIEKARLSVLQTQYPDTFKALSKHSTDHESVRLGYASDLARLLKAPKDNLTINGNLSLAEIQAIAKASKQKSPRVLLDEELALNWNVYSQLTPDQYAAVINGKLGTDVKPGTMKKRAVRLGLSSGRSEGRPDGGRWNKSASEENSAELARLERDQKITDGFLCANCFTPMREKSANHRYCQKCGYLWDELV